jgi:outer membrane PBP1 activator LpoA protein
VFKKLPIFILFLALFGCSILAFKPEPGVPTTYYTQSVADYLQKANTAEDPSTIAHYRIQAAGRALVDGKTEEAKSYLALTDGITLPPRQKEEKAILEAKVAANEGNTPAVLSNLATINEPTKLPPELARAYYESASQAHQSQGQNEAYCTDLMHLSTLLPSNQAMGVRQTTLLCLEALPNDTLQRMAAQSNNNEVRGWVAVAELNKDTGLSAQSFQDGYQRWLQQYPNHPASILFPLSSSGAAAFASGPARATTTANVDSSHIALLLPTTGSAASAGQSVRDGFMAAYYSHPSGHSVKLYDTNGADIAAVYSKAIDEGATMVVGPLTKPEVSRLADSGIRIPTLVLNNIPTQGTKRNLYQFALSPNDEAEQVAQRAYAQGFTRALVIAPADSWGQGVVNSFAKQYNSLGGQVRESVAYTNGTPLDSTIKNALQAKSPSAKNNDKTAPDRRQDIDVIFLVATPDKARAIKPLLNFYYANNIPVYATSIIYTGVSDPFKNQDLNGIQFSTLPWYLNNSAAKANTTSLYAFGYDAYNMATNFNQLTNGYSGVTGVLYLRPNQQIYRQGVWAQFRDGEARAL